MNDFSLTNWQKKCIDTIKDKDCVILSSPTGSGKTACYETWALGKKERPIFITAPIKALSNQRFRDLTAKGYKVAIETGDVNYYPYDDCDIICCTQEIYHNKYKEVPGTTVIIDEFSYIYDDPTRARVYIDSLAETNATNIMICSATFGNSNDTLKYINDVSNRDFYLFENYERLTELEYKGSIPISRIHNSYVVAYTIEECYNLAKKLYNERLEAIRSLTTTYDPRNRYKGHIKNLANKYEITNDKLIELALMGIVYYCGKLFPKEKMFVEELIESRYVDTIVGTNALALGVNFPIESVVFAGLSRGTSQINPKGAGAVLNKSLFEQLSGRAGRKKYFDKGYVYYCDDFYHEPLDKKFWDLVKRPPEDFHISLGRDIQAILTGNITVEQDSKIRVRYSTEPLNYEEINNETQEIINFVKTLDITQYYFKTVYNIDISNGFYQAISGFSEKRQQKLEKISEILAAAQESFTNDIGEAYSNVYGVDRNCKLFIDILIKTPLEQIIKSNAYNGSVQEYDMKALLDLRKYMQRLPYEYVADYDLNMLDTLINCIDPTILYPYKYRQEPTTQENLQQQNSQIIETNKAVPKFKKNFEIVEYDKKKYIKLLVENEQILLCDYEPEGELKLNYIPSRSRCKITGYIDYITMSEMIPRIDFSSFGEISSDTSINQDSNRYEQLLMACCEPPQIVNSPKQKKKKKNKVKKNNRRY